MNSEPVTYAECERIADFVLLLSQHLSQVAREPQWASKTDSALIGAAYKDVYPIILKSHVHLAKVLEDAYGHSPRTAPGFGIIADFLSAMTARSSKETALNPRDFTKALESFPNRRKLSANSEIPEILSLSYTAILEATKKQAEAALDKMPQGASAQAGPVSRNAGILARIRNYGHLHAHSK